MNKNYVHNKFEKELGVILSQFGQIFVRLLPQFAKYKLYIFEPILLDRIKLILPEMKSPVMSKFLLYTINFIQASDFSESYLT